MNGDHPTSGDYAWAEASRNSSELDFLRGRVERLENTVSDLLTTLSADGTIEVTDPDHKGHFADKESD